MQQTKQLPLSIALRDDSTLESFFPGNNSQALQAILKVTQGQGEPFIYLWGGQGAGATHLLQAACHAASEKQIAAVYLPLKDYQRLSPEILQGLEKLAIVCLDDLDAIAGNKAWEEAIFHLFNRIKDNGGHLIVSADQSPKSIDIKLADLKSRLAWGVTYHLEALNEVDTLQALQLRACCRGLELSRSVGQFLLRRCPRDMNRLFETLQMLDKASLTYKRKLTIPFVKDVLSL